MAVVRGAVRGAEGVTGPLPAPPREAWGDLEDREREVRPGRVGRWRPLAADTYLGLLAEAEVEDDAGGYCSPPPV